MEWLLKNREYDLPNERRPTCHQSNHSYRSMYGRLRWERPAQTITSGFGSMGQGRYVHPSRARTLTPHEAARLQFLPDFMDFSVVKRRGALAQMIGNAAPPLLTTVLVEVLIDQGLL
jgi:DNA (cytosine-5)-methyltransferase 1